MAFYYSLNKQNPKSLIESKLLDKDQLNEFNENYLVNGFDYPKMPVLNIESPGKICFQTWGFVPKSVSNIGHANAFRKQYNTIIVESERITDSRMYKDALLKNRCLILCSGYFEWQKFNDKKYPYYINLKENDLFVIAGVWEEWTERETNQVHRCYSIITTKANSLVAKINNLKDRMPLILDPEKAKRWLNPKLKSKEISTLLKPIESKKLKAHTIAKFSPLNKDYNTPEVTDFFEYKELKKI